MPIHPATRNLRFLLLLAATLVILLSVDYLGAFAGIDTLLSVSNLSDKFCYFVKKVDLTIFFIFLCVSCNILKIHLKMLLLINISLLRLKCEVA
jgi:hypothetical protein